MMLTRRSMMTRTAVIAGAATAPEAIAQTPNHPTDPSLRLWYDKPAGVWTEALPVGNGRLGAMIFGTVKRERLQLNEDTLWSGGPYHNVNPKGRAALPEIRDLIFSERFSEAEALADKTVQAVPMRQMSYQCVGDLWLDFIDVNETAFSDYVRELDLNTATCRTRFTSEGVTYIREVIASYPDNIIAIHLRAEGGPLSLDIGLSSGLRATVRIENDVLILSGVNNTDHGNAGRLGFEARAQISHEGGSLKANGSVVEIRQASSVVIRLAMATSFKSPADVSGDPAALTQQHLSDVRHKSFEALTRAHIADYRSLFNRVQLELPKGRGADRHTATRVKNSLSLNDPSLAALYFQFGRYLLIASSRGTSQPANLQGIWNDLNRPPWGSKYTLNINAQMNYWPADPAGLSDCLEPFVRMVEELSVTGAMTARDLYGARGWVTHHNTDLWRASGPVDYMRTGLWPCGGAWLCNQLWDHYDYMRDPAYLRRIYPLLKNAALFFVDTLQKDPNTGFRVTNPSNSPENDHGRGSTLCAGPAMDNQILRDLFAHTIAASEQLKTDAAFQRELTALRAQLPPDKIGKSGQLQEWQADWDDTAADIHHRHVSHLYGLFPSQQINLNQTPQLAKAAEVSLNTRGDEATGWGVGWRLNLWAHLQDGERAHSILRNLLSPDLTYPNLFDSHPPFQIDGNFGGVRGIIEMIVQSREDDILLLPALPAAWPEGRITGIRLRNRTQIDLSWRNAQVTELRLISQSGGKRKLHINGAIREITLRPDDAFIL
ncbi:MAG: glycoside hydrolase family 95 protein [Asticcacaulis sp.]